MGTPWYTVLSNDQYKDDFAYVGAFVEEREKLIENGNEPPVNPEPESKDYPDGMTDEERKEEWELHKDTRIKCEQSDLVILLLNIACVPDSVIKLIPNFEDGWSAQFIRLIENYKHDFRAKDGAGNDVVYRFQDGELEDQYATFVKNAQAKDTLYDKDKKEYDAALNKWNSKHPKDAEDVKTGIN
jgi:hypothetical protein